MTEGFHHVGDLLGPLVLDAAFFARLQIGGERLAAFLHHARNVLGEILDVDAGRSRLPPAEGAAGGGRRVRRLRRLAIGCGGVWLLRLRVGRGVHAAPCFGHISQIADPRATSSWGHMGIRRPIKPFSWLGFCSGHASLPACRCRGDDCCAAPCMFGIANCPIAPCDGRRDAKHSPSARQSAGVPGGSRHAAGPHRSGHDRGRAKAGGSRACRRAGSPGRDRRPRSRPRRSRSRPASRAPAKPPADSAED